MQEKDRAGI